MALTADSLYGFDPTQRQPTPTGAPDHIGGPEPVAATRAPVSATDTRLPAFALVAIVGAAIVLTQVSFRGEIRVKA
jgi:hypothetical protein